MKNSKDYMIDFTELLQNLYSKDKYETIAKLESELKSKVSNFFNQDGWDIFSIEKEIMFLIGIRNENKEIIIGDKGVIISILIFTCNSWNNYLLNNKKHSLKEWFSFIKIDKNIIDFICKTR